MVQIDQNKLQADIDAYEKYFPTKRISFDNFSSPK